LVCVSYLTEISLDLPNLFATSLDVTFYLLTSFRSFKLLASSSALTLISNSPTVCYSEPQYLSTGQRLRYENQAMPSSSIKECD